MAQHVVMVGNGEAGLLTVFAQGEVDGERCRGFRCSLRKNARPGAFMRVRSTSQALMARISSPRRGWVVESPPLRRASCSTRLSTSTCSSTEPQASETRSPCRNINRTRQLARISFRLPLMASRRRSNSLPERCFRSVIHRRPAL